MKAVVVVVGVLLALACFATATEQTVDVSSVAGLELGNAPQAVDVDQADTEDEVDIDEADEDEFVADENDSDSEEETADETDENENEADEETEDEEADEAEEEAAEGEEQEEAGEFSLLEASATADVSAANAEAVQTTEQTGADADRPRPPFPNSNKPFKFHSERIVAQTSKNEDPEMAKLDLALAAVKEDILATNKQITDERKWVIAVAKIIASYNDKMKRVEAHIIALRKEMKNLYRKKKQIENLKLQKALEAKLKEARDELATLTASLGHVQKKQGELNKSGRDLRETIAGIQAQLAKLRGQQLRKAKPAPKKRCKKGLRWSRKAKKCVKGKKKGRGLRRLMKKKL